MRRQNNASNHQSSENNRWYVSDTSRLGDLNRVKVAATPITSIESYRNDRNISRLDPFSDAPISSSLNEKFPFFQVARGNGFCYFNSAFVSILHSCVNDAGKMKILRNNLQELDCGEIAEEIKEPLTRERVNMILNEEDEGKNIVVRIANKILMPLVKTELENFSASAKEYIKTAFVDLDKKKVDQFIDGFANGSFGESPSQVIEALGVFSSEQRVGIQEQIGLGLIPINNIVRYAYGVANNTSPATLDQQLMVNPLKKLWPYDCVAIDPMAPADFEPKRDVIYLMNFGDKRDGRRLPGGHFNVIYSKYDSELVADIDTLGINPAGRENRKDIIRREILSREEELLRINKEEKLAKLGATRERRVQHQVQLEQEATFGDNFKVRSVGFYKQFNSEYRDFTKSNAMIEAIECDTSINLQNQITVANFVKSKIEYEYCEYELALARVRSIQIHSGERGRQASEEVEKCELNLKRFGQVRDKYCDDLVECLSEEIIGTISHIADLATKEIFICQSSCFQEVFENKARVVREMEHLKTVDEFAQFSRSKEGKTFITDLENLQDQGNITLDLEATRVTRDYVRKYSSLGNRKLLTLKDSAESLKLLEAGAVGSQDRVFSSSAAPKSYPNSQSSSSSASRHRHNHSGAANLDISEEKDIFALGSQDRGSSSPKIASGWQKHDAELLETAAVEDGNMIQSIIDKEYYDPNVINLIISSKIQSSRKDNSVVCVPYDGFGFEDRVSHDFANFATDSSKKVLVVPFRPIMKIGDKIRDRQHFVGLHIKKNEVSGLQKYEVAYFDPTGRGVVEEIPQHVINSLKSNEIIKDESKIIPTSNQIQHAENGSRRDVLPYIISNNHCGAFVAKVLSDLAVGDVVVQKRRLKSYTRQGNELQDIPNLTKEDSNSFGMQLRKEHYDMLSEEFTLNYQQISSASNSAGNNHVGLSRGVDNTRRNARNIDLDTGTYSSEIKWGASESRIELEPSVNVRAILVAPVMQNVGSIWHRMSKNRAGDYSRENKFKLVNGVYSNEERVQNTFVDILNKLAGDELSKEDVLEIIKQAKIKGGIFNKMEESTGKYAPKNSQSETSDITYTDQDGSKKTISASKAKKFSKAFQLECEACGIYSGREGGKSVGLRLTFIPDDVVQKLKDEKGRFQGNIAKAEQRINEIKENQTLQEIEGVKSSGKSR